MALKNSRSWTKTVGVTKESLSALDIGLLAAARRGDQDAVERLINKGANVNAVDPKRSKTCVDWAIHCQDSEMLHLLLSNGASANIVEGSCHSPLRRAIAHGNLKVVQELIKAGANVNAQTLETPLHHAVQARNPEILGLLLEAKANPNMCDSAQFTPLQRAIRAKEPGIVRQLIDANANVNAKILKYYHTLVEARSVLHDAVEWADTDIVKLLLESGAKVEIESYELSLFKHEIAQPSVLYVAAANKRNRIGAENKAYLEVLKLILDHEPNINRVQRYTQYITPFNAVVKFGDVDAVRLFLDHDVDFSEFDNGVSRFPRGATPLHLAASNPDKKVLELLLELGHWNVNSLDYDGFSALFIALIMNKPDHLRLLLSKGADAGIPVGLAIMTSVSVHPPDTVLNRYYECLEILFDAGADIEGALLFLLEKNHDIAIKSIIKFIARMESCGSMLKIDRNFTECTWAQDYYQECEAELKLLRESILEGSISLYDLLIAEDRSLFGKSESVVDALKTKDLKKNFPNYGKEILDQ